MKEQCYIVNWSPWKVIRIFGGWRRGVSISQGVEVGVQTRDLPWEEVHVGLIRQHRISRGLSSSFPWSGKKRVSVELKGVPPLAAIFEQQQR